MRLFSHAQLLRHPDRGQVARIGIDHDPVQTELGEAKVEQGARRLGDVAVAPLRGVKDVPQRRLTAARVGDIQADTPYQ